MEHFLTQQNISLDIWKLIWKMFVSPKLITATEWMNAEFARYLFCVFWLLITNDWRETKRGNSNINYMYKRASIFILFKSISNNYWKIEGASRFSNRVLNTIHLNTKMTFSIFKINSLTPPLYLPLSLCIVLKIGIISIPSLQFIHVSLPHPW